MRKFKRWQNKKHRMNLRKDLNKYYYVEPKKNAYDRTWAPCFPQGCASPELVIKIKKNYVLEKVNKPCYCGCGLNSAYHINDHELSIYKSKLLHKYKHR